MTRTDFIIPSSVSTTTLLTVPINSPSTVMTDFYKNLAQTIGKGVKEKKKAVEELGLYQ